MYESIDGDVIVIVENTTSATVHGFEQMVYEVANLPEWATKEEPDEWQVDSAGHYYEPRGRDRHARPNAPSRHGGVKRWSLTATVG